MNTHELELKEIEHAEIISKFVAVCVIATHDNPGDWDAATVALLARAIELATGRKINIQGMFK